MEKTKVIRIIVGIIIAVAVLGYAIFPFDVIPDMAIGAGQIDDIVVAVLGTIGEVINIVVGKTREIESK